MQEKLISIIIPTYKRPDVLPRAVDSVLAQSYKNIEVIVVDDNDPTFPERAVTEKVMEKYADEPRVKYIKHPKNMNGSAARNTGFANSSGEYIMFLDDDDEFLPGKIEKQYALMESLDESWGISYTIYETVDSNGKIVSVSGEKAEGRLLVDALGRNLFLAAGSNLMVRKKVYEELNGFDESFKRNQDLEFLVRALKNYKIAFADVLGLRIYMHNSNSVIAMPELTKQFVAQFSPMIQKLSEKEKTNVFRHLGLQVFRYYLFEKDFKNAKKAIKEYKVGYVESVFYLFHLVYRKISKLSVGYKFKFN